MSRPFWAARLAFGRVAMRIKRCRSYIAEYWDREPDGCWKWMFGNTSTASSTPSCGNCWPDDTDGVVRRMIDKWLKAGVLEQGQLSYSDAGTPQGGVISPMLSNVSALCA